VVADAAADGGAQRQVAGQVVQQVELVGPDGATQLALYTMERDGAGHWRIAGCSLVPSVRVGA